MRVNDPEPAIYGDYVWLDANADGIQDEGAAVGVNDVRVELYAGSDGGQVVAMTFSVDFTIPPTTPVTLGTTCSQTLIAGDYFAVFTPPDGTTFRRRPWCDDAA